LPLLGILSSQIPVLAAAYKREKISYTIDSAAARAEPGFAVGDRIIAASSPDDAAQVTPLARDPRRPDHDQLDYFDLRRRLQRLMGKAMNVHVERVGTSGGIDIKLPPAFAHTLGLRPRMGQIVALREDSPAVRGGVRAKEGTEDGDVIAVVEVIDGDGKKRRYSATPGEGDEPLDPLRLPTHLALWAMSKPTDWRVQLTVLRPEGHKGLVPTQLELTWDNAWDPLDEPPTFANSPLSLSGLGIAYRVQNVIDGLSKDSPAASSSVKAGDTVKSIQIKLAAPQGRTEDMTREVKEDTGAYYFSAIQEPGVKEVTLTLSNDEKVTLIPREDPTWPLVQRGLAFEGDTQLQRTDHLGQAIVFGFRRLGQQMGDIYEFLFDLMVGEKSANSISGPITIAAVSYSLANRDVFELIMFLAVININLAVVNFRPIPVLDGGHMVFLVYEKLRGKPPTDQVRFIATIVGLVVVLGLMVFAFSVDIRQWFF